MPARRTRGTGRVGHPTAGGTAGETPFAFLSPRRPMRTAPKRQLLEMSLALEEEALGRGPSVVLLSTFQEADFFTPANGRRYEAIAARAAFVGALAVGLGDEPAPGVRGARIAEDDPLRGEWDVVVLGPHFAGAFVARDLEVPGLPDADRRFEYALTFERDLVVALATRLMRRITSRVA